LGISLHHDWITDFCLCGSRLRQPPGSPPQILVFWEIWKVCGCFSHRHDGTHGGSARHYSYNYFRTLGPDSDPNGVYVHFGIDFIGMAVHLLVAAGIVWAVGKIFKPSSAQDDS
jgi:hypothetical protein